ncbi:uncharacterized protein [Gorilla gorilla gorilla]|uniref:uncharacterized protein n=1 Tax=Gorilla gorilla gorilla TaxID=9595 RepID=UPI003009E568
MGKWSDRFLKVWEQSYDVQEAGGVKERQGRGDRGCGSSLGQRESRCEGRPPEPSWAGRAARVLGGCGAGWVGAVRLEPPWGAGLAGGGWSRAGEREAAVGCWRALVPCQWAVAPYATRPTPVTVPAPLRGILQPRSPGGGGGGRGGGDVSGAGEGRTAPELDRGRGSPLLLASVPALRRRRFLARSDSPRSSPAPSWMSGRVNPDDPTRRSSILCPLPPTKSLTGEGGATNVLQTFSKARAAGRSLLKAGAPLRRLFARRGFDVSLSNSACQGIRAVSKSLRLLDAPILNKSFPFDLFNQGEGGLCCYLKVTLHPSCPQIFI